MKIKHKILTYTTLCLLSPLLITLLLANSTSALTQTSTANAAIRVRSTCSMTATIDSGNEHTATMINGQYKEDVGLTTIQTFCNDPNGYAIYAIGYTGEDAGVAAGTNTVLHSNVLGSSYDIITGTSTNGLDNNDTSNWAMKISSVDGTYRPDILNGYNNFSLVPQNYTKVASYNTATDLDNPASTRLGSNLTTTYAAYISNTQPAGTYEGAVKYVLVHPSTQIAPYYMQDIDQWRHLLALNEQFTAIDERDNKTYTVALLADGNIWMTQNLDLCIGCAETATLTSDNTDLNLNYGDYTTEHGVLIWEPDTSTMTGTPATINASRSVSGWQNDNNHPYQAKTNDVYVYQFSSTDPYYGGTNSIWFNSLADCMSYNDHSKEQCMHYNLGTYYNWTAAVAMNNTSRYNNSEYNYYVMENSICPKGWRLPNGLTKEDNTIAASDFNKLFYDSGITDTLKTNNYVWDNISFTSNDGGISIAINPFYIGRTGFISASSLNNATDIGAYWTSTIFNSDRAYGLNYSDNKNSLNTTYPQNRFRGTPVRCVAR